MPILPLAMSTVMGAFAPLCSTRVFEHAMLWLVGAILAPGRRAVAAVWRIMGNSHESCFQSDHRVLKRARWSSIKASRVLQGLLLAAFVPEGPVVIEIDETIARRRGAKIAAKGISRDPVRSSNVHVVKTSGRRWVSLMVLARIPWAERVWALSFLTVLAPSERYDHTRGRQPRSLLDRARQAMWLARRWLPTRELVVVGDRTYAALVWLDAMRAPGCSSLHARPTAETEATWATPQAGEAAADPRATCGRPNDPLEDGHHGAVGWACRTCCPHRLYHRRLGPLGCLVPGCDGMD